MLKRSDPVIPARRTYQRLMNRLFGVFVGADHLQKQRILTVDQHNLAVQIGLGVDKRTVQRGVEVLQRLQHLWPFVKQYDLFFGLLRLWGLRGALLNGRLFLLGRILLLYCGRLLHKSSGFYLPFQPVQPCQDRLNRAVQRGVAQLDDRHLQFGAGLGSAPHSGERVLQHRHRIENLPHRVPRSLFGEGGCVLLDPRNKGLGML